MIIVTLTNEEFMEILNKACKSDDFEAYLTKYLSTYSPYNMTFKNN